MRKSVWGHWPSWLLALFLLAYAVLAPSKWKLALTHRLVHWMGSSQASSAETSSSHPDLLDQWSHNLKQEQLQAKERMSLKSKRKLEPFRNVEQMQTLLGQAQLAQVTFHPQVARNGVIWIQSRQPLQLQSAVTVGDVLIGYIDLVSQPYYRVRLLSDPACQISVRTLRPKFSLQELLKDLQQWREICLAMQERPAIKKVEESLEALQNYLVDQHLASEESSIISSSKGVITGSDLSWRNQQPLLKGMGFNYLQNDAYGPVTSKQGKHVMVQVGDELVTSGLDGRFPPHLRVARVIKVTPQDSAGTLFQIEALPIASHLEEIRWVWVLPVVGTFTKLNEK